MPCDKNDAELLNAYLAAEERYKDVSLKAHAFVPGEPLQREWLDESRINLITERERERDAAQQLWHDHLVGRRR